MDWGSFTIGWGVGCMCSLLVVVGVIVTFLAKDGKS